MSQKPDDLDALRTIITALEPFEEKERERILRWAMEKLGLKNVSTPAVTQLAQQGVPPVYQQTQQSLHSFGSKDIKSFLLEKSPTSANQLVAAVAYYHKFEAPEGEKKSSVGADDILEACRKANLERPKHVNQIMVNANAYGVVDKVGTGSYEINAVGENLVAVSMPTTGHGNSKANKTTKAKKPAKKRAAKKK